MRTSDRPHWREVRDRLRQEGVALEDAVVADWELEGSHVYCGVIGTRDERLFHFCVTFGYDREGRETPLDVGYVQSWKTIASEDVGLGPSGGPNSWLCDTIISRRLFEAENAGS